MSTANVNDRASIERIYPRDAFDTDAAKNSRGKALVLEGVLIASQPAENGEFELVRKRRHMGENDPEGDTLFVAPYRGEEDGALQQTPGYGALEGTGDAVAKVEQGGREYEAFIDRIIATAKAAHFKEPIGRHEERLKGFHGG